MPPLYAIRQISTGHYLPMPPRSKRRRTLVTHDEPLPNVVPRMFQSRKNAILSLQLWLRGKAGSSGRAATPVPTRRAEDMEIVRLYLSLTPTEN